MTLIIEKNPDVQKLSFCFQKIEKLAQSLGVDIDDLCKVPRSEKNFIQFPVDSDEMNSSFNRKNIFLNQNENIITGEAKILGLNSKDDTAF